MKKCSKCKKLKSKSAFYKRSRNNDGLRYHCKECEKKVNKKHYCTNSEAEKGRVKSWRKDNPERSRESNTRQSRAWRKANPEKAMRQTFCYFARTIGVSPEIIELHFNEKFTTQNGCCAICGIPQTKLSKRMSIDHNHTTNKLRGLLCNKCNVFIGLANEDISVLEKAIQYLKNNN